MDHRRAERPAAPPVHEHGEEPTPASPVRALLRLQRGAGNAAVAQLVSGRMLLRGQGSSTGRAARTDYKLVIGKLEIPMTWARGYFRFDAAPHSYIHANSELQVNEETGEIRIRDRAYEEQIERFCGAGLQLWRGITRQHPLWYEVDRLHIVLPLGTGELPDFDTNATSFIPFGHSEGSAKGIAIGKRGMGPGDERRMIANYPALRAAEGASMRIGGVISVTVGIGRADAGFYNSGEIQVRGPLTTFEWTPVLQEEFGTAAELDAGPSAEEAEEYTAEHGALRHALVEQALAAAGPAGPTRLEQAKAAGATHAAKLMTLRLFVSLELEDVMKRLAGGDQNIYNRLDSSVNREAHAGYLAAVIGGASIVEAMERGSLAASSWLAAHGEDLVTRARAAAKSSSAAAPH